MAQKRRLFLIILVVSLCLTGGALFGAWHQRIDSVQHLDTSRCPYPVGSPQCSAQANQFIDRQALAVHSYRTGVVVAAEMAVVFILWFFMRRKVIER